MKIPASPITGQMQRVIETAKGFILNGSYYSDTRNALQNYLTLPISNSDIKGISIQRSSGRTPAGYNNMHSGQNWIVDSNDPTITYVFVFGDTSTTYGAQFLKIKENEDGSCETIYQRSTGVAIYGGEMLWQNDAYILFTGQTGHNNMVMYWLDKNTLVQTTIGGSNTWANGANINKLWEDSEYIYFLIRYQPGANDQHLQIWTYSKVNKSIVVNQTGANAAITDYIIPRRIATAAVAGFNIKDLVIKTGPTTYTIYAPFLYNDITEIKIRRIKLDFSRPKGSALNADKNFTGAWCISDDVFTYDNTISKIPFFNTAATYAYYTLFPIVNKEYDADADAEVEKMYLGVGFSEGDAGSTASIQQQLGVYVYRLNERTDYSGTAWTDAGLIVGGDEDAQGTAGTLELCATFNTLKTSDYVRDVFPITADGKYVALRYLTRVQIVKLDSMNILYTLVRDISANARILGTDKYGYFYICSSDDAGNPTQRINLLDSNTVHVELEKYSYNYTGEPIETYATVYARAIDNAPIEMTVDLVGSANVKFTESNGQRVAVDVEAVATGTQVPFTITSAQTVEITPVAHV